MHKGTVVVLTLLVATAIAAAIAAAGIVSGSYDIGADAPHSGLVAAMLETARTRSIRAHAQYLQIPPDLDSNRRFSKGASEYAEMCSQCHLAPGMEKTEISQGLYPKAPEFARGDALTPGEQYWVIKHGIKFTSMPAWGPTHGDDLIWDMVSFVRKLPSLSPAQYKTMVAKAPEEHEHMMHDGEMQGVHMPQQDSSQ